MIAQDSSDPHAVAVESRRVVVTTSEPVAGESWPVEGGTSE